ncbi:hypothetical protein E2C01_037481 [Portunus trituberculatus]|uniref:Uncharacterized protein n=1 Tax=Portunus trituberculatus TaxID=210409 RepID=A0A5B7FE37_PORTR|nr:hypothetical protein [Portunus trituberculatus]
MNAPPDWRKYHVRTGASAAYGSLVINEERVPPQGLFWIEGTSYNAPRNSFNFARGNTIANTHDASSSICNCFWVASSYYDMQRLEARLAIFLH